MKAKKTKKLKPKITNGNHKKVFPSNPTPHRISKPLAASIVLIVLALFLNFSTARRMIQIGTGQDGFDKWTLGLSFDGVRIPWGYAGWVKSPGLPSSSPPLLDQSINGGKLIIDGISFSHGIGTHAPSKLAFSLEGKFRNFSCYAGLDQTSDQSHGVVYCLWADGHEIYRSPKRYYGSEPLPIKADVTGVKELVLGVNTTDIEDASSDVDWVQLRFEP